MGVQGYIIVKTHIDRIDHHSQNDEFTAYRIVLSRKMSVVQIV